MTTVDSLGPADPQPLLCADHRAMLQDGSGILPDVIAERGYKTIAGKQGAAELTALGFPKWQTRTPGLLIPLHTTDSQQIPMVYRPDTPRKKKDSKSLKYETRQGAGLRLDCPPRCQPYLGDPAVPLWVTEGQKKGDALASIGCCALALLGVYGFKGKNGQGGITWLADWDYIALKGRDIFIVFDSDAGRKPGVHKAQAQLAKHLTNKGARVQIIALPDIDGQKAGVDDYLVAGHTKQDLEALREAPQPPAHPPVPPDPETRYAGPYEATPSGFVWWKPIGAESAVKVTLTNFTAQIVADVVEDDGAETRRYFELEACHEGRTSRFTVEASHFAGMAWGMEHLGARAMIFPGILLKDHARAAVQMFSQEVEARIIYTHLGWRKIGETWCYLHAGGAIGPDGLVSAVEVNARQTLGAYILPRLTTREAQRAAIRDSLGMLDTAADRVTVPLYAAIWRAVLGQVDCSLHLVGETGAGKSELAALAQQHYGAGLTARHLPASWTSTGNALEGLAFEAKDSVLVVDDFCPSGSTADIARFHRDADRVLRAQGNGSARQRMNRDGSLRAVKPPRGLIVSTGEDVPQGASLRSRMLILEVAPDSVQWDSLTACQSDAAAGTYATALAGFVQWLAPRYAAVSQGLQAELIALRQAMVTSGHRRTPEIVANLALGMQYLMAYAHAIGALTAKECTALWKRSWTALVSAGEAQQDHQANEDPVRRFLALLSGALAAGLAHVADVSTLGQPTTQPEPWGWRGQEYRTRYGELEMAWHPQGPCIGWLAADRLYLEPEAAFSVVQKFGESQRAPLPISQQTLWKRMHEQGLLVRLETKRGNRVERTVAGKTRYVVDISIGSLHSKNVADVADVADMVSIASNSKAKLPATFPKWYAECCGMAVANVAEDVDGLRNDPAHASPSATNPFDTPQHSQSNVADLNNAQLQQNQSVFQENSVIPPHPPHPQQIPTGETPSSFIGVSSSDACSGLTDEALQTCSCGVVVPPCALCGRLIRWHDQAGGVCRCVGCDPDPHSVPTAPSFC